MGFIESLIMTIFAKKAVKEICKEFSDERPVHTPRGSSKATYHNLREVYYNIEDFPPSLLEELFRYEPDFLDKESCEDVRELLGVQATHYLYKGVLHSGETWFTISAKNRYICKELLSTIMDRNFRNHDLIDYSNCLFSPVANPAQHSITIGDYTLYYKYALFYNLTLMLLIDADKKFLSGKRVNDRAVHYPKVRITDEIVNQYGLAVDETAKTGVRLEKRSYAVLDDFNSPDVYNKRVSCNQKKHTIVPDTFCAEKLDGSGFYSLPIHRCVTCGRKFAGKYTLNFYQREFGKIRVAVQKDLITDTPGAFEGLKPKSELHAQGYNVVEGQMSETERRNLLIRLLQSGEMTYFEICRDIKNAVQTQQHLPFRAPAVAKWKSDLEFLSQYIENHSNFK